MSIINNAPLDEMPARAAGAPKTRRSSPDKDGARNENVEQESVAVEADVVETAAIKTAAVETAVDETIMRKKGLLLASLRIWELKQRISE